MSWLMATPWMGIASASCETKLAESTWHTSTNFQVAASSTRNPRRSHNKSLHFFHVSVKANGVWEILIAGTGRGCMYHKPWRSSPGYLCDYQKRPSHTMNLKMLKTFSSPSERCPDLDLQIAIRQRTATRARPDGPARCRVFDLKQTIPELMKLATLGLSWSSFLARLLTCPESLFSWESKKLRSKKVEGLYPTNSWQPTGVAVREPNNSNAHALKQNRSFCVNGNIST